MLNLTTSMPKEVSPWTNITVNLSLDDRYPNVADQLNTFIPVALWIDRIITPIWYFIGIIGNSIAAKVWLEKRIRLSNSSAIYLATLALSDLLFLLLHMLMELKYAWKLETLSYPVLCEAYFMFYLATQYLSPLLVLGFTVERYIAICHPFKKETYCTPQRALNAIIVLVSTSVLLCVVQAWFWTYRNGVCTIRIAAMKGSQSSIWSIWTWTTETAIFLAVPIVILIFNILVIREINKINKKDVQKDIHSKGGAATTVMLLTVSFYVIFTTLPASLVYSTIYALPVRNEYLTDIQIRGDHKWQIYFTYMTIRKIIEEICLSHYACNIFIYLITGVHFRQAFIESFRVVTNRLKGIKRVSYNQVPSDVSISGYHKTKISQV